jgi:hypothetical protein
MPDEVESNLSGESPRQVLEGEVFQPRTQPDEGTAQGGVAGAEEAGATAHAAGEEAGQRESIERGLAQYVFVREEREREVRLMFRDASPGDIAHTFRSAGAHLITLSAERASMPGSPIVTPPPQNREPDQGVVEESEAAGAGNAIDVDIDTESDEPLLRRRAARQRSTKAGPPTGEVLLRYFYALGEIVYTVSIVSLTGAVTSIAATYPVAARSERELSERLAIAFV